MKEMICSYLAEQLEGFAAEDILRLLEVPPEPEMGDFALPCFAYAKVLHRSPASIAEDLAQALMQKEQPGIDRVEAVGGYLNFYINRAAFVEKCLRQLKEPDFGLQRSGAGKVVCMDYSSPNIAKNFHVGHLRTTIIGNSLYKIYDKLGWKVVRINYLGDWGTQFGKLIVAYKKWSSREAVEEKGIEELLRIYVKFNQEAETDAELMDEARQWFVRMEQGDEEALDIWQWFKAISMTEFERVYKLLDVSFDFYTGESFFRDKVPALVEELQEKGLLTESQGAYVIDLQAYDMPPCLILKSDGGSIYHSRDIAALLYRKREYHFDKCLYVTGLEQSLHFKQIFQAIQLMGYDWYDSLVHVPYGLVSLQGEKLSSRKGNIIYAEDILQEAMDRALAAIEEKNPDLPDKERVAWMVGVGAVIFHDLYNQRIKNVDFSWEEVLSFEGTTGPYVQYTYARARSVLRKNGQLKEQQEVQEKQAPQAMEELKTSRETEDDVWAAEMDMGKVSAILSEESGYALLKLLAGYPEAVEKAAQKYEPSVLARYAIDVSAAFNRFYHECPILHASAEEKQARLLLVQLTCEVLSDVCGLLGMKCPEEM